MELGEINDRYWGNVSGEEGGRIINDDRMGKNGEKNWLMG